MDRREVVRVVRVCLRILNGVFDSGNVFGSNAFGNCLPIFGSLFGVLPPAVEYQVFCVGSGEFSKFCRFSAWVHYPVFEPKLRAPSDGGLFFVCPLLSVARVDREVDRVSRTQVVRASNRQRFEGRRGEKAGLCHRVSDDDAFNRADDRFQNYCRVVVGKLSK